MAKQVPAKNGGTLTRPDKGETMNPNGRPKKGWGALNDELEKEGIEPVSRESYRKVVIRLMSCDEDKMKQIQADKKTPQWIRWMIADLAHPMKRARIMEDLRNYTLGTSAAEEASNLESKEITVTHQVIESGNQQKSEGENSDNP